jgi:hypothetical protein
MGLSLGLAFHAGGKLRLTAEVAKDAEKTWRGVAAREKRMNHEAH